MLTANYKPNELTGSARLFHNGKEIYKMESANRNYDLDFDESWLNPFSTYEEDRETYEAMIESNGYIWCEKL